MQNRKNLVFITGIPGVGKSDLLEGLVKQFAQAEIKIGHHIDYPVLRKWVLEKGINQGLAKPAGEGNFDLYPWAYPDVSREVAAILGRMAREDFNKGREVVLIEAARGAGSPVRDENVDGLLIPVLEQLKGGRIKIVNIEVRVPILEQLGQMNLRRFGLDAGATLPEVFLRYLDGDYPACSSVEQFANLTWGGEVSLVMNVGIENSEFRPELEQEVIQEKLAVLVIDDLMEALELRTRNRIEY